MPRSTAPLPLLGDLEQAVLRHLWDHPDEDVHDTHHAVGTKRGISANTIGSALERLHKKGLLTRTKVSHSYRYRATMDEETYRARRVLEAAGGVRALGEKGVLDAFVNLLDTADSDALNELERLISEKRAGRRKGTDS